MSWDEQRRLRQQHASERGGSDQPTEPMPAARMSAAGHAERLREAGGRWGWMVAVGLAAAAVLMSGVALARSGDDGHRGGRDRGAMSSATWQQGGSQQGGRQQQGPGMQQGQGGWQQGGQGQWDGGGYGGQGWGRQGP